MADNKTRPTVESVDAFIQSIPDEKKRKDSQVLLALMRETTGSEPKLWGDSMVGFGSYHYRYASGREGDYFLTGFAPRKANLTIYIMSGFEAFQSLLERLGKHKTSVSCLYINNLADIDLAVLRQLIERSVAHMKENYPYQE